MYTSLELQSNFEYSHTSRKVFKSYRALFDRLESGAIDSDSLLAKCFLLLEHHRRSSSFDNRTKASSAYQYI